MFVLIAEWLRAWFGWKTPLVFTYFSTRMILAAVTALLFTIYLGPRFIKKLYELKIGQPIRGAEECPLLAELHGKKKDTPTMGGILILSAMLTSLVLWMDPRSVFTLLFLLATVLLGFLGGFDDYMKLRFKNSKGIKPRKKMLFQTGFAALVSLYLLCPAVQESLHFGSWFNPPSAKEQVLVPREGKRPAVQATTLTTQQYVSQWYFPFFKEPIFTFHGLGWLVSFFLIWFVITGTSNAVNLTDGLDGLAAGCLIMTSLVLGLFAFLSNHIELARYLNILYIEGSGEIAVYLLALAGACLGFLWYNGYPAQVFMGDTGSLALGGILGLSAVLLRREVILAIAGGVFVMEAMSVILQVLSYRYRNKKRIFLIAPLHHHFEYKGWPETKVVIRFWILSLLFAMLAVAAIKFQ